MKRKTEMLGVTI